MGHTVRTGGPLQAPKDRGSPRTGPRLMGPQRNGESKACACGSSERPASLQVNRLERHAGKLARAVLRGRGPGDRLLLPDRPLVPRSRFRQQAERQRSALDQ